MDDAGGRLSADISSMYLYVTFESIALRRA